MLILFSLEIDHYYVVFNLFLCFKSSVKSISVFLYFPLLELHWKIRRVHVYKVWHDDFLFEIVCQIKCKYSRIVNIDSSISCCSLCVNIIIIIINIVTMIIIIIIHE
jgi:hypothetical protein